VFQVDLIYINCERYYDQTPTTMSTNIIGEITTKLDMALFMTVLQLGVANHSSFVLIFAFKDCYMQKEAA